MTPTEAAEWMAVAFLGVCLLFGTVALSILIYDMWRDR